jgi:hypothetical protein
LVDDADLYGRSIKRTDFGGRWVLVDDAFVWTTHLYGRSIKRAILVDDAFVWTTPICMDDRLLSERFWWTTHILYGRRTFYMDDALFVWTTPILYGRPICMDDAYLYGRRICMDDADLYGRPMKLYGRPPTSPSLLSSSPFLNPSFVHNLASSSTLPSTFINRHQPSSPSTSHRHQPSPPSIFLAINLRRHLLQRHQPSSPTTSHRHQPSPPSIFLAINLRRHLLQRHQPSSPTTSHRHQPSPPSIFLAINLSIELAWRLDCIISIRKLLPNSCQSIL